MIHYVSPRFRQHSGLIERAASSMLSMAETARATPNAKGGVRFDRGCLTLVANPGGVVQWRDVTARKAAAVDFQGVYMESGTDPRLAALRAMEWLRHEIDAASSSSLSTHDLVEDVSQLRRPYVALRAAAALKGLHHADLHVQHPWGLVEPQALIYCNGPGPYTLHPEVHALVFEGISEGCSIDAMTVGETLRVEISGASWVEEVNDGPMSILRFLSECGLTEGQLELRREWR